jgi:hypothetical protein
MVRRAIHLESLTALALRDQATDSRQIEAPDIALETEWVNSAQRRDVPLARGQSDKAALGEYHLDLVLEPALVEFEVSCTVAGVEMHMPSKTIDCVVATHENATLLSSA